MRRREFLRVAGGGVAASLLGGVADAAVPARRARGPKVVLIRFGGGVRPQESISPDHENHAPLLFHRLLPEGTLLEKLRIEGYTTHSVGTMNLSTGRYRFPVLPSLNDEFRPADPTFLELARRELGLDMHEALVVNNGRFTEWVGWSDDGVDHRPGLLSQPELARADAEHRLERAGSEREEREAKGTLERLDADCYRGAIALSNEPMKRFWREIEPIYYRGRQQYRGTDELVFDLAREALERLSPHVMMVNFQDVDYAHWGLDYFYRRGLRRTDRYTWELYRTIQRLPFYRDDTLFLVVPDCGRGRSPLALMPAQHHEPTEPGSDEIFLFAAGPGVARGRRLRDEHQQVDVAPTIGAALGLTSEAWEGRAIEALLG